MADSVIRFVKIIFLFNFFRLGLSREVGNIVQGLDVSSVLKGGKWHHTVSSARGIASQMGLSSGQELLYIQPSSTEQGIPCVGRPFSEILREFQKFEQCQEFTIAVRESSQFKIITGYIGGEQRGQPGPGPGHPRPPLKPETRPHVKISNFWATDGFTVSPQRVENVFIQPYAHPSRYMKAENGNIRFAALRDHTYWKFKMLMFLNFTALMQGELEEHALFKCQSQPRFIHTTGNAVSLLMAQSTGDNAPQGLIQTESFIQHFVDPYSRLGYYEPSHQRGKYVTFNPTSRKLTLTSSRADNSWFYTRSVESQNLRHSYSGGSPGGPVGQSGMRGNNGRSPIGRRPVGPAGAAGRGGEPGYPGPIRGISDIYLEAPGRPGYPREEPHRYPVEGIGEPGSKEPISYPGPFAGTPGPSVSSCQPGVYNQHQGSPGQV